MNAPAPDPRFWDRLARGKAPFVNVVKKKTFEHDVAAAGFKILETASFPAKSRDLFIVGRKPASRNT